MKSQAKALRLNRRLDWMMPAVFGLAAFAMVLDVMRHAWLMVGLMALAEAIVVGGTAVRWSYRRKLVVAVAAARPRRMLP